MKRVLVIIPAYNEEESIVAVVQTVVERGYDYIVVNDGSLDNTLSICRSNGINVLNLKNNLGIGGAVQAGHKYALANGYDIDIQFDGDGQHDADYIPDLLRAMDEKGADLVIGSRFIDKSLDGFKSTSMRRAGIKWLSSLIGVVGHVRVTDPTSGFRACGRSAIDLFCKNYPIDYPEPESIVVANNCGLKIVEQGVVMKERQGGSSSIKAFSSVYYMIKVSLAIIIAGLSGKGGRA